MTITNVELEEVKVAIDLSRMTHGSEGRVTIDSAVLTTLLDHRAELVTLREKLAVAEGYFDLLVPAREALRIFTSDGMDPTPAAPRWRACVESLKRAIACAQPEEGS